MTPILAAAVFIATALAGPAAAQSFVIVPGQEQMLATMLATDGPEGSTGCRFLRLDVNSTFARAAYDCGTPAVATIELHHPSALSGSHVRRTKQFAITASGAPPRLVESIVSRVSEREASWKWSTPSPPPAPHPASHPPREHPAGGNPALPAGNRGLERFLVGITLLVVAALPFALVTSLRSLEREARLWLAAGAALAFLIRTLAPHRLVMVYFGYEHVGQAVDLHALSRYGPGATVLWWLLFHVVSPDHAAVQWLHAVLGSLAVGFWSAWAQSVAGRWAAGLTCLFLAASPMFVRDHVSESMGVPAGLVFAAAAPLAVRVAQRLGQPGSVSLRGEWPFVSALVLLGTYGAACRPDLAIAALPFVLAFALVKHSWAEVLRAAVRTWAFALGGLALTVPLLVWAAEHTEAGLAAGNLPRLETDAVWSLLTVLTEDNVLFRPAYFPVALWIPLLIAARGGQTRRVWWLVAAAMLSIAPTFVDRNDSSIPRLHAPAAALVVVAAAVSLARLRQGGRRDALLAAVLAAAGVVSLVPTFGPMFRPRNPDVEDALLRDALQSIRGEGAGPAQLLFIGYEDAAHEDSAAAHFHFPAYLFRPHGITPMTIRAAIDKAQREGLKRPYFLRSLRCYLWPMTGSEPKARRGSGLQPSCARVCEVFRCDPLFERDVPNLGDFDPFDGYGPSPVLRVGLYRLQARDSRDGPGAGRLLSSSP